MSEQPSLRERVRGALAQRGLGRMDVREAADVALAAVSAHITEGRGKALDAAYQAIHEAHMKRDWRCSGCGLDAEAALPAVLAALGLPSPEQEQSG